MKERNSILNYNFAFLFLFLSPIILISYASVSLLSKYQNIKETISSKVETCAKYEVVLYNITLHATNIQRKSLNLIYTTDKKTITTLIANISKTREKLKQSMLQIQKDCNISLSYSSKIIQASNKYLASNLEFLQKREKGSNSISLADFNVGQMRPTLDQLNEITHETFISTNQEMQSETTKTIPIYEQIDFWILLLGFAPLVYFLWEASRILFVQIA